MHKRKIKNPYENILKNMEKKIEKSIKKLNNDFRKSANIETLVKDNNELPFTIEEGPDFPQENKIHYLTCPDCGGTIEHESGCIVCKLCGYSKCS